MSTVVQEGLHRMRRAVDSGEFAALCRRHAVHLAVLFGSGARGTATDLAPRDIDLAIRFTHPGGSSDLLALYDDLFHLVGTDRVDLMDLGHAGPVAKQQALTRGRPLYEREQGAFARAQMAAIGEYMDTEPLRELQRELLRQ